MLASLQQYLHHINGNGVSGVAPLTRDAGGPTPCLVTNVPRLCAIDTSARYPSTVVRRFCKFHTSSTYVRLQSHHLSINSSMRVPHGLYGRCFATAKGVDVLAQTTIFSDGPRRCSNILAIEAPKPGRGTYTNSQISDILCTAYSGFLAARSESVGSSVDGDGDGVHVVRVHSGHWQG